MGPTQMTMRLKRFGGFIKGGVVGAVALALVGIILLLILGAVAEGYPFIGRIIENQTKHWTIEKSFTILAIVSFAGFILGALASTRHSQVIERWFGPAIVIGILLTCGLCLLNAIALRAAIPQTIKLLDCTNGVMNIHLTIPKGHAYQLELVTPAIQVTPNGTATTSYKFSGSISISNKLSLVADIPINSDKAWLTASCFVLTGVNIQNTNVPPLGRFIQPQKDYDIQITLNPPPPPSSSIWLYWLQSNMDTER
jgi:hypothetical protein